MPFASFASFWHGSSLSFTCTAELFAALAV